MSLPTREKALTLLEQNVKDDYQILHAKMVAAATEAYAHQFGEDADLWYITGLLHDIDYFEYPTEHPDRSLEWFKEWGYPEELITAVKAHKINFENLSEEPETKLSAALIACDEMSGLLYAYSLMRPEGFNGMAPKGVRKRFKDKSFAAKVSREDINYGMEQLGVELADHATLLIETFQSMEEFKT